MVPQGVVPWGDGGSLGRWRHIRRDGATERQAKSRQHRDRMPRALRKAFRGLREGVFMIFYYYYHLLHLLIIYLFVIFCYVIYLLFICFISFSLWSL